MTRQTLAAAAVGLALSLSLAATAGADVGDDIRDHIAIPSSPELADRIEIDCDPRVCGNPPDFVIFDDFVDEQLSDLPAFPRNIEDIPNIRFRVPLP